MLEIMKFYGKKIQLASMRGISWHVVVFSGKRGVYANSLSGPLCDIFLNINFVFRCDVGALVISHVVAK